MRSASERDPWLYVDDMRHFAERVQAYAGDKSAEALCSEPMRWDALLHNLALLGEACSKVPDAIRQLAPGLPWRSLIATRNRVIHAYLGVDSDIVHSIVRDDLPVLREALRALLQQRPHL